MHVHILGICGTLMGSIALLARQLGHTVSGSDQNVYPPMSDQLSAAGIDLAQGYKAASIPADVDLVMIGNAGLPRGNEAVEYVLNKGIPYTSGAEWLGRYLLADRWVIAVAGTHGKTTTTSMVAWALEYAGLRPGFLIGGIPANFPESARLGDAPFFVIEADEYDTSYFDRRSKFLHYRPHTVILNNLEYDHADIFPNLAAIQYQFHLLLRTIPSTGLIVHPQVDTNIDQVFDMGCWTPRLAYANTAVTAAISARSTLPDGSEFEVTVEGKVVGSVKWSLTGQHNVNNALAAIAACRHAGVAPATTCAALCEFKGVKRRMEKIYATPNLTVYDDFAHHPTAIATTLAGLRAQVGDEKILVIIEPRSHTMKIGTHEKTLDASVDQADEVIWFRSENIAWSMDSALTKTKNAISADVDDIIAMTKRSIDAGTRHVVIMSNGGFGGIHKKLVQSLPQPD